jgi:hypothetical protein
MRSNSSSHVNATLGRFGFLFADLFAVLAMLFLLANTVGHVTKPPPVTPTPTFTPTAQAQICGLQRTAGFDNNSNPFPVSLSLANDDPAAINSFQQEVQSAFTSYYRKHITAGFVLIWGVAADVGTGDNLAAGAKIALQNLGQQGFVFTHTSYQPLWDGNHDTSNGVYIRLTVFFYTMSANGKSCTY